VLGDEGGAQGALNQVLRTLAVETARTHPDLIVAGLHPGTVQTGLSQLPVPGEDAAGPLPGQPRDHPQEVGGALLRGEQAPRNPCAARPVRP
jgi:hypothetical protein